MRWITSVCFSLSLGEHNGFWKISRSEIYDNLPSSDLNDLTELTVFFHDDGDLAGESEFRNLRYQVSKLNFHIDSAPTIHEISEFGIHNYTFFQTRFRYTKANAGTHHIKHWLAHSHSPYLYLTIKQLGEADNNRFTSSSVKPVILLTRNTHQPTIQHRSKRTVNTDGSELIRRRCEDFGPGYTGCCLREHIVYLRDQLGSITTTTDLPNGPTSIRVCKGTCQPSKCTAHYFIKYPFPVPEYSTIFYHVHEWARLCQVRGVNVFWVKTCYTFSVGLELVCEWLLTLCLSIAIVDLFFHVLSLYKMKFKLFIDRYLRSIYSWPPQRTKLQCYWKPSNIGLLFEYWLRI